MKEWVMQYWLETCFGILTILVGAGYKRLIKKINEQEAIKMGVQALLRDRIIQTYHIHMEKGYVPISARENIDGLTREYYNLGGNGVVHSIVEKLLELPTYPDKQGKKEGEQ